MIIPLFSLLSAVLAVSALIVLVGTKDAVCRVASIAILCAAGWLGSGPYVAFIAQHTPALLASILVGLLVVASLVLVFRADRPVPATLLIASSVLLAALHFTFVAA